MKKEENCISPESINISLEEFDSLNGNHVFSEEYEKNKKNMLREYRKSQYSLKKKHYIEIAAGITLLLISGPIIANAATDGELFNRIWGNLGKSDIASHDEEVYDEDKDTSYTVTYPERDYEETDSEKAQELVGDNISYEPIIKDINGTKFTILSAIKDKSSAVIEFTLEKQGGVDALIYSQLDNEAKGARFSDKATFYFTFGLGSNIYVDLSKSTNDKLYCYDYIILPDNTSDLNLQLTEYPCTRGELASKGDSQDIINNTKDTTTAIPVKQDLTYTTFESDKGGSLEISPISINIDMSKGLGIPPELSHDPWNCYYVSINYKDGTNYIVSEHQIEGKHACNVETNNSSYSCGVGEKLIYLFNRLVDTSNIESITINDTTYTMKK